MRNEKWEMRTKEIVTTFIQHTLVWYQKCIVNINDIEYKKYKKIIAVAFRNKGNINLMNNGIYVA